MGGRGDLRRCHTGFRRQEVSLVYFVPTCKAEAWNEVCPCESALFPSFSTLPPLSFHALSTYALCSFAWIRLGDSPSLPLRILRESPCIPRVRSVFGFVDGALNGARCIRVGFLAPLMLHFQPLCPGSRRLEKTRRWRAAHLSKIHCKGRPVITVSPFLSWTLRQRDLCSSDAVHDVGMLGITWSYFSAAMSASRRKRPPPPPNRSPTDGR